MRRSKRNRDRGSEEGNKKLLVKCLVRLGCGDTESKRRSTLFGGPDNGSIDTIHSTYITTVVSSHATAFKLPWRGSWWA